MSPPAHVLHRVGVGNHLVPPSEGRHPFPLLCLLHTVESFKVSASSSIFLEDFYGILLLFDSQWRDTGR